MNDQDEILACIENENIKYLQSGQISKYVFPASRSEAHEKKIGHLIIRLFAITITPKNDILYLVQKRGKNKKSHPLYFSDSASGHVLYEKNLNLNKIKENALRELEEEFGIPEKVVQKIKFYDLNYEKDNSTSEIAFIFLAIVDYNVKLKPSLKELEPNESKFYNKQELENLLGNQSCVDYSKEIWKKLIETDITDLFKIDNRDKKSKNNRIALFIGRFQPLHHGHIYVIKSILKMCKLLKIGIGSSQFSNKKNDPFTSEERKEFIKATLNKRKVPHDQFKIYEIPDIFNAQKWVDHVLSIIGEIDIVFSNSDWVRQLFQNKGVKVGKKLVIFKNKYNATNIRNFITNNDNSWKNLVPNEVIDLIQDFNGIERIKSFMEKKS